MIKMFNCLILSVLILFFSCQEAPKKPESPVSKDEMRTSMEKANRYLVNEEEKDIESYIRRHGLEMVATGTGLRYQVLRQGSDELLQQGQRVSMEYQVGSVAGDVFYSSDNVGIKTFVIGKGEVESGLDEAVTHFHRGDYGIVIIPAHLGYGLHGDNDKILEYTTLVYKIKIIESQ